MKEKKKSDLTVLLGYTGSYKGLTFLGLGLSAVAMVLGMLPYICIWLVARDLIARRRTELDRSRGYCEIRLDGLFVCGSRDPCLFCGTHVYTSGGLPDSFQYP